MLNLAENWNVDQAQVDELSLKLKNILDLEIKAGNSIAETWTGWPYPTTVCVALLLPFLVKVENLPEGIVYRDINDPHYWKADYYDSITNHMLVCGF